MTHDLQLVDPREAETAAKVLWDRFAQTEPWKNTGTEEPDRLIDMFLKHVPGGRMLDVGCGWAPYAYQFLDAEMDYTGIDISPAMIQHARESYPEFRGRFQVMSYRDLQFPGEYFGGIWCRSVFSTEPKRSTPNILKRFRRVLVPGGIIAVSTSSVYGSNERVIYGDDGRLLSYRAYYDLPELSLLVTSAGFSIIESLDEHGEIFVLAQKT